MDDDKPKPQLSFANKTIAHYAKATAGVKSPSDEDYRVIRVTFRKMGGSWEGIVRGDVDAIRLISSVVKQWAVSRSKPEK